MADSNLDFYHGILRYYVCECSDEQSPSCQCAWSLFLLRSAKYLRYRIFRRPSYRKFISRGKTPSELPQWLENLIFTLVYRSNGLRSVLWIWIIWDPDLFWLDPDHWKSCGSSRYDFQPLSQTGNRVVGKSAGSENLILPHIYECPTQRAVDIKRPIFKEKKGSRTLI
jgi:hypothetical protein